MQLDGDLFADALVTRELHHALVRRLGTDPLGFEAPPLLLLDLFECLQEELLDVAALVEDHLRQSLEVGRLLDLQLVALGQCFELVILLLYDLLVLKFDQFTLFFEVADDLVKAAFEQVNLRLELLDLLVLPILLLGRLHVLAHLGLELALQVSRIVLQIGSQPLEVLELLLLDQGLILQPLVLSLNVALDLGDVLFSLPLGLGVFLLELEVEAVLDLLRL